VRAVAILVGMFGASACDEVFSLDRPPIDAAIDGPPVTITGQLSRTFVHNDASGAPTTTTVVPEEPTAFVAGAEVPLTWNAADGTFSFGGDEGGTWSVRTGTTELSSRSKQLELVDLVYGRPEQRRVEAGTALVYEVTSPAITAFVNIDTTGVWSASPGLATSETKFALDWTTAGFQGVPGIIEGSRNDELFFAWFDVRGVDPDHHFVMSHVKRTRFDQAIGDTSTVSSALGALLPGTACAHVAAPRADALERLDAAYPGGTPRAAWALFGVPRAELGVTAALTIATASGLTNVDHDVAYTDPFTGLDLVLTMTAATDRMVDGRVLSSATSSNARVTREATCNASDASLGGEPPMPTRPRLSGALLADRVTVGLAPDERAVLTWEHVGSQVGDAHSVILHEVTGSGALRTVRHYVTSEPHLVFDVESLPTGSYQLDIRSRTGVPRAAIGDVTEQTYPFTQGLYRAVFSVSREP